MSARDRWPERTNAGPIRTGVQIASHPQGVRLDGHLLRGGAATRRVDHCTSPPFVLANRIRCFASTRMRCADRTARSRRPTAAAGSRPPCRAPGPRRVAGSVGDGDRRRPATIPTRWIQRLSGVSHLAIVSLSAPLSASSIHCWTVPLPNVVSPTSVARSRSWSAPATISLAEALPRSMRTTTLDLVRGREAARGGVGLDLAAVGVLLPEERTRRR